MIPQRAIIGEAFFKQCNRSKHKKYLRGVIECLAPEVAENECHDYEKDATVYKKVRVLHKSVF
jgi:hypothetical protein